MWNNEQSDVVRIYRTMDNQVSEQNADKLYQKFNTSRQEPIRLAVAIRGFFLADGVTEEQRDAFAAYLKRRIRPAAEALIEMNDVEHLEALEHLGWLDGRMIDNFLQTAIHQHRSSVIVWLMQLKAEKYGYRDRDFSL